jgi:hypothetical protein
VQKRAIVTVLATATSHSNGLSNGTSDGSGAFKQSDLELLFAHSDLDLGSDHHSHMPDCYYLYTTY